MAGNESDPLNIAIRELKEGMVPFVIRRSPFSLDYIHTVSFLSHTKPGGYRGTSLISDCPSPGPYSRPMPRPLWWSLEGGAVSYERGTPVSPVMDAGGFKIGVSTV